jgi:hypothetical protein
MPDDYNEFDECVADDDLDGFLGDDQIDLF